MSVKVSTCSITEIELKVEDDSNTLRRLCYTGHLLNKEEFAWEIYPKSKNQQEIEKVLAQHQHFLEKKIVILDLILI
jgi:hypothetical protein